MQASALVLSTDCTLYSQRWGYSIGIDLTSHIEVVWIENTDTTECVSAPTRSSQVSDY